jgi:hypothetical protein
MVLYHSKKIKDVDPPWGQCHFFFLIKKVLKDVLVSSNMSTVFFILYGFTVLIDILRIIKKDNRRDS